MGLLSTLAILFCIWRIWAWLKAKRQLKKLRKEEEEAGRARAETLRKMAEEREERERTRHERYLAHLEQERAKRESPEYKAQLEAERRAREEREKKEIADKLKEKQRRRALEEQVRQDMINSGELFGDQPKRPPIPREVVDAVYRRDGARCVYCGSTENLQLDHIIPFSKGGATTLENLQLLCQKCNLEKSNKIG